mmetsp:Transcript_20991/g.43149  ORF Transcript_20991/g.43149 Transcript_20991/m.43149 type:complete len:820 (-) Transcript_20991:2914-5373(-)
MAGSENVSSLVDMEVVSSPPPSDAMDKGVPPSTPSSTSTSTSASEEPVSETVEETPEGEEQENSSVDPPGYKITETCNEDDNKPETDTAPLPEKGLSGEEPVEETPEGNDVFDEMESGETDVPSTTETTVVEIPTEDDRGAETVIDVDAVATPEIAVEEETEEVPSAVIDDSTPTDEESRKDAEKNDDGENINESESYDQEEEWLKQESFVEPDEEDVLEDDKIRAEQEERAAVLEKTKRKQEEMAKQMAEVEAKLQQKEKEEAEALREEERLEEEEKAAEAAVAAEAEVARKEEEKQASANLEAEKEEVTETETEEENLKPTPPSPSKRRPGLQEETPFDESDHLRPNDGDSEKSLPTNSSPEQPASDETNDKAALSVDDMQSELSTSTTKATDPKILLVEVDDPKDDGEKAIFPKEESSAPAETTTSRTTGMSFAQAFSKKAQPPTSLSHVPKTPTPTSANVDATNVLKSYKGITVSRPGTPDENNSASSHSALSASRNKKASDLINKYQEKVAHSPLPGDAVLLKNSDSPFTVSPGSQRFLQEKAAAGFLELNSLPDMKSVRDKFEKSSRRSIGKFEFGESFRQKKRIEQLSEKEREEEAKVVMRGFNEKDVTQGKSATGEIDTSHLPKSFTFEMSSPTAIMPNDGICRVDYKNADFRSKIFVVHKTRGMLLLQDKPASANKNTVPGGSITEEEFLAAAKISGSPQVQLQIAAREAAARRLYESTGLDIRQQADRFKPAVLSHAPATKTARGYQYLRNEYDEQLYYFLQVDEEDFLKLKNAQNAEPDARAKTWKLTKKEETPGRSGRRTIDVADFE